MTSSSTQTLVLLGLGHTNAHIVKKWAEEPLSGFRLVCISKFPVATYSGMFPGTLAGQFEDWEFRIDLADLVQRAGGELILAEVNGLDLKARRLHFADRQPLPFDLLSIGVGSMPDGWRQHMDCASVVPIKPMQSFQQRLESRLDVVARDLLVQRPQPRQLQIAIVGGGAASVEIALCLDQRLRRERPDWDCRIAIYTRAEKVCQDMRLRSISRIESILQSRSISIHYHQTIRQVDDQRLISEDGQAHSADCVIWATGASAPPVLDRLPLAKDERGFIAIGPTLQSLTDPHVFAVGDSGTLLETPFPKAGVYAVRQCPVLWHNLKSMASGTQLQNFHPQSDFLKLLNTGDGKALLEYGRWTVHARWCWHLKTWIDKRFVKEFQGVTPLASASPSKSPWATWHRWAAVLILLLSIVALRLFLGDRLSLATLAASEGQLTAMVREHPLGIGALAFLIYVLVTGLSLPGAAALSLAYAWIFGFWKALLIVSFASTAGATIAFLLSRYLFRDWVQSRLGKRFQSMNEAFEREGAFYLFTLRLIPLVPFFAINAAMGLTGIRAKTFWWVSQVGMLPGTVAYVYAGSVVPNVQTLAEKGVRGILDWRLLIAFGVLGLLPLLLKRLITWANRRRSSMPTSLHKQSTVV